MLPAQLARGPDCVYINLEDLKESVGYGRIIENFRGLTMSLGDLLFNIRNIPGFPDFSSDIQGENRDKVVNYIKSVGGLVAMVQNEDAQGLPVESYVNYIRYANLLGNRIGYEVPKMLNEVQLRLIRHLLNENGVKVESVSDEVLVKFANYRDRNKDIKTDYTNLVLNRMEELGKYVPKMKAAQVQIIMSASLNQPSVKLTFNTDIPNEQYISHYSSVKKSLEGPLLPHEIGELAEYFSCEALCEASDYFHVLKSMHACSNHETLFSILPSKAEDLKKILASITWLQRGEFQAIGKELSGLGPKTINAFESTKEDRKIYVWVSADQMHQSEDATPEGLIKKVQRGFHIRLGTFFYNTLTEFRQAGNTPIKELSNLLDGATQISDIYQIRDALKTKSTEEKLQAIKKALPQITPNTPFKDRATLLSL